MTRLMLRLAPAAALAALLTGCTGYAPPPLAQIECEQQEPVNAGADYLNCIRGWTAQQNAQAVAAQTMQSQSARQGIQSQAAPGRHG